MISCSIAAPRIGHFESIPPGEIGVRIVSIVLALSGFEAIATAINLRHEESLPVTARKGDLGRRDRGRPLQRDLALRYGRAGR